MRNVSYQAGEKTVQVPVAELSGDSIYAVSAETGEGAWHNTDSIRLGEEKRHDSLPEELLARIRTIRQRLGDCDWMTWDQWVDGFLFDANPDREIDIWLRTTKVFDEHAPKGSACKPQRKEVLRVLLNLQVSDGGLDSLLAMHGRPAHITTKKIRRIHADWVADWVAATPGLT